MTALVILVATVAADAAGPSLADVPSSPQEREVIGHVGDDTESAPAAGDAERLQRNQLRYRERQLRVEPVARTMTTYPCWLGDNMRLFHDGSTGALCNARQASRWGYSLPTGGSAVISRNWTVVRGSAEQLDDLDLAVILENDRLIARVEEYRFWERLLWVTGFGVATVAGTTTGFWLLQRDDSDTRTIGVSLVMVGLVSGALALLFPTVGARHVFEASEAEALCGQYNATLRTTLDLRPEDVEPVSTAKPARR